MLRPSEARRALQGGGSAPPCRSAVSRSARSTW